MADQQQATQKSHPSSQLTQPEILNELFDLTGAYKLDDLLSKALRTTIRLLGAEAGSILFQGQPLRTVQSGAFRPEAVTHIEHWEDVIGTRIKESDWHIPATAKLPVSTITLTSTKVTLINAPLLRATRVVGALSLVLPPNSTLTQNHHQLLTFIAKSLGQSASLVAELELAQRRLQQINVFYDVGQALVTTFDIDKLLLESMELATKLIDAGAASIMLIDDQQEVLVFRVSHGGRGNALRQQRIPLDEGIAGWVASHGRPVIANDARADERFSHRVDVRTGYLTQSLAAVPLRIKGRIIGVLEVLNKYSGDGFNQNDIQLMNFIATQAAIAIENARLYQQLREERDHLLTTHENTRHKLVTNLREGPVHLLSAISMGLDHLDRLSGTARPEVIKNEVGALRNLVHQATQDAHSLLFELYPPILEIRGLAIACEQYINQLRRTESFKINFDNSAEKIDYNLKISSTIFIILQEAITNIKQHANASQVWIKFGIKDNSQFMVSIKDDGSGFDIDQTQTQPHNQIALGLLRMGERAAAIDATLQIDSQTQGHNQGTTIKLLVPWPPQEVNKMAQ